MATQLSLDLRRRTWGGARDGAGRTRTRQHDPAHRPRPEHVARHPVHAVLRTRPEVARLRTDKIYKVLRHAVLAIARRDDFRIVHLSIQHNHLHLLVEAKDNLGLSHGMQAFAISAAKAINRALERTGKVFAYRYHATAITNRRQARHELAYVLNNWRRHRESGQYANIDRYSSGVVFDGWTRGAFPVPDKYEPLPVRAATTWLLREGWKLYGAIDPREVPGPPDLSTAPHKLVISRVA